MLESCQHELAQMSDSSHIHEKILNKALILKRLDCGYYRTIEGLGYDIIGLIGLIENSEEDKILLSALFDLLVES